MRSSFSTAFRYPSAYYSSSSYVLRQTDNFFSIKAGTTGIEPEKTISLEGGIRYNPTPGLSLDASIYYTRTSNFINYDFQRLFDERTLAWGFQNDPDSFNRLIGMQLHLFTDKIFPSIGLETDVNLNFSKGKERVLEIFLDDFNLGGLTDLPVIRAQPDFVGNINTSFAITQHTRLHLNHSFMTSSWTRNKLRIAQAIRDNKTDELVNSGFYTIDLRSVFRISRQLTAYVQVINLLNTRYSGIDVSVEPDVLLYNPQPLRTIRVGVNFSFN